MTIPLSKLVDIHTGINVFSPDTVKNYRGLVVATGDPLISEITEAWLSKFQRRIASSETWNLRIGQIKVLTRLAISMGHAKPDHPALAQKKRRSLANPARDLPKAQFDELIRYVETTTRRCLQQKFYWLAILHTFYYTGIRRRQLCELRWSDVDLRSQTITLRAEGSKTNTETTVPLHPTLFEILRDLHQRLTQRKTFSPDRQIFHYGAAVPGVPTSEILTLGRVSDFFTTLTRGTGIRISAHRLRHTFATTLVRSTNNIKTVQFLMTHSHLKSTMHYVHATMDDMLATMETPIPSIEKRTKWLKSC